MTLRPDVLRAALLRYDTEGNPSLTFDGDGKLPTREPKKKKKMGRGVADGRIVAAGADLSRSADNLFTTATDTAATACDVRTFGKRMPRRRQDSPPAVGAGAIVFPQKKNKFLMDYLVTTRWSSADFQLGYYGTTFTDRAQVYFKGRRVGATPARTFADGV